MSNVHDLATMRMYGRNVKLFVVNNDGYVSMRNTQREFFGGLLIGADFPDDVKERISTLVNGLNIPVGFHGHNNLGMAVINSVTAVNEGATIIDGSIRGFGAGAGNTQLEVLVAVFDRLGFETGIDLYTILDAADLAEKEFNPVAPSISPLSIVSGFAKPVARAAQEYQVDPRDIFFGLGKRNAVAGQESLIIEVARDLATKKG